MNRAEHFANRIEQTLAVRLRRRVRKRREVLHVADHVGQTELHAQIRFTHVFSIRAEIIAAEHAFEFVAERLVQDLTAPRLVDPKKRKEIGAKAPGPESL